MLLEEIFTPQTVTVLPFGNVLTAVAGLHELLSSELQPDELNYRHRDYEVTLAARAIKKVVLRACSL